MPLTTRPATSDDYDAFTRLFPELEVPDPLPSLERFTAAIVPDALVALDDDRVVGITWARKRGASLHIVYLITDRALRRRGIGVALMHAAAARGRAQGLSRWMLNVKPENLAARALYERCGMKEVMASASMRLAWADVPRLPASPPDTTVGPLVDDAAFEDALGLGRGELAASRALPGRVLLGAMHHDERVGVVGFDAAFPGASPFRLRDPIYARAVLEALRPLARPEHTRLFAFVEGDPALEAAFAAAGATVALRTLRLEGALP